MYRILLVDDEDLIRVSLRYAVERSGADAEVVAECSGGREALDVLREIEPDIIITDIRMPHMDGLEMIRQIRQTSADVQIIIISGYAEFEYARQAIQYRVSEYLLKPVSAEALKASLEKCVAQLPPAEDREETYAQKIVSYIKSHYAEKLSLDGLAARFGFTSHYISTLIKRETGESFNPYVTSLRIRRAMDLLARTDIDVKEIALQVGYDDQHYFSRLIRQITDMSPTQYRQRERTRRKTGDGSLS